MENTIPVCDLQGGVGNQLFQIAAVYSLAKRLGSTMVILDQQFSGAGQGSHPSKYYDTLYKRIRRVNALQEPILRYNEPQWAFYDIDTAVRLLPPCKTLMVKGYFQSDRYFHSPKSIRALFTPDEGIRAYLQTHTDLLRRYPALFVDQKDACLIGVRRGDYIKVAHVHNPCGMDYYKKAIALLPAKKYYIVSDDIAWCRANFVGDQYVFFDIEDDLVQLYAGCLFKNYIIGNSSYHWWMSFLSVYETPTIVAPDRWVFGPDVKWEQYSSIYRKGMVVVERDIEL